MMRPMSAPAPAAAASRPRFSNAYENIICLVFIGDFIARLRRAPSKRGYFIGERGWLDLLGSIPSFGFLGGTGKWSSLFRLARLSRLLRNVRLFRKQGRTRSSATFSRTGANTRC